MISLLIHKFKETSPVVLILAIILTILGLITLNSIGTGQVGDLFEKSFFKQILFLLPATFAFILAFFIPRYKIHRYIYIVYGFMILVIMLPFLSREIAHTNRWIDVGLPFGFQPSEFAKWIVVIGLARYLSDHNLEMKYFTSNIFPIILAVIPSAIVLAQPDLGTAIIIMVPVIPMLYWAGARPFHLFLLISPALSILSAFHWMSFLIWITLTLYIIYRAKPSLIFGIITFFGNIFLGLLAPILWQVLKPYQQKRILTLFNPEIDPLGSAYQIIQSKTAIGSGGLFGKGWGQGTQTHLKFLPVQESDFIVSVIGEEFGFSAILILIIIFSFFIIKTVYSAYNVNDRFSSLVLLGLASIFTAHVFVNFAMTVGMIPVKGLPLPFVSYGGSFLLSCFIMLALIMNFSIESKDY